MAGAARVQLVSCKAPGLPCSPAYTASVVAVASESGADRRGHDSVRQGPRCRGDTAQHVPPMAIEEMTVGVATAVPALGGEPAVFPQRLVTFRRNRRSHKLGTVDCGAGCTPYPNPDAPGCAMPSASTCPYTQMTGDARIIPFPGWRKHLADSLIHWKCSPPLVQLNLALNPDAMRLQALR